ncbi:type IV pilin N-terminal domain-containing protein [Halobaculum lipolyticum]|uniref:Type IV pilin N-terminal domain-containing protein n=1 Tax=Halobaculum lipolyticum TaxID=3032001 RepID=A0ABD5W4Q3_9EURY|nr:type IV pilin N-terminal domain-containing protein [Halobaculum sp. DT31]
MSRSTHSPTNRPRDGDRALSPAAGVVFVVALTVALAALVGSLLVAAGAAETDVPPTASFEFSYAAVDDGYAVTATHAGGATFDADDTGSLVVVADTGGTAAFDSRVVAGTDATVGDDDPVPPDTVVRVVWRPPDGGDTRTLATDRTPA